MKTLNVLKRFTLYLPGNIKHQFEVGVHEVSDQVAAHWYTLLHATVAEVEKVETKVEKVDAEVEAEVENVEAEVEAVVEAALEAIQRAVPMIPVPKKKAK